MLDQESQKRREDLEIHIPPGPRLGNVVIEAEDVSKGYGDNLLVDDMTFKLPPGGIVGVIGPNGAGKTTLFRMITGQEQPDSGTIRIGETVALAYVDQSRTLDPKKSIWEEISGGADLLKLGAREVNSRAYVARFNFSGSDQQKKVGVLSGGERNRVHLAKMLKEGANVLLLDEPTNDLGCEHAARARRSAGKFRRLRGGDLARSLVSRSHRDAHPRVRRRQQGCLVRRQLFGIRS